MSEAIKPMTAAEFTQGSQRTPEQLRKIEIFNEIMKDAQRRPFQEKVLAVLHFSQFGYDWQDVSFVETEAGFKLVRNSPCLWWEVMLPD